MSIRETAREAVIAEAATRCAYEHTRNYWKLHIFRDGEVQWDEYADQHSDIIDRGAKGFAAVPSVARVGTGSCYCNCDYCAGPFTDTWTQKDAIQQAVEDSDKIKRKAMEKLICIECFETVGMHADGTMTCACACLDPEQPNPPASWDTDADTIAAMRAAEQEYAEADAWGVGKWRKR